MVRTPAIIVITKFTVDSNKFSVDKEQDIPAQMSTI